MEKKERDPLQLTAEDVEVGVLQVSDKAVKLRLWPNPERVREILDKRYKAPEGWSLKFVTGTRMMVCELQAGFMDHENNVRFNCKAAVCPSEYHMMTDQARNEMNGAFIMAASYMGIGSAIVQLPSMVLRADQVQINPVPDASGKRIARYDLADTLTPTNLVYDASGHIVEVDFTRRNGGVIKWQKR